MWFLFLLVFNKYGFYRLAKMIKINAQKYYFCFFFEEEKGFPLPQIRREFVSKPGQILLKVK